MSKRLYRGITNKPLDELYRIKAELMAEVELVDMAIGLRKKLDDRRNGNADPPEVEQPLLEGVEAKP